MIHECACPHYAECSAIFDQKQHDPPCSTLPIHLVLAPVTFVSPDEKVLKEKYFADVEEVKQKMAEALKGIKQ